MADISVEYLDCGTIRNDLNFNAFGRTIATESDPEPVAERGDVPCYSLVIDHPEGVILWDTGSHPEAGDGHWPADLYDTMYHYDADTMTVERAIDEAGYSVDDVDYVVMTHLHMDHTGGLRHFEGTDVPIFVHEEELKFAYYSAKTPEGNIGYVDADFDRDLNWEIVHRQRETHFDDIEFIHLPGHTPGLIGGIIDIDDYGTLVVAGDLVNLKRNYENLDVPGTSHLSSLENWHESIYRLKEIERKRDVKTVLCGHDPEQYDQFNEDGWP
jgi:glyoxylase-like metal-dependent hydrolase (beta-lactamase superfamily II)